MTTAEFTKDETRRLKLAELLKDDVLREALEVLKSELEPKDVGNDALVNPVLGASKYQQIAGANHIIHGLQRLTAPFTEPKKLTGKTLHKS